LLSPVRSKAVATRDGARDDGERDEEQYEMHALHPQPGAKRLSMSSKMVCASPARLARRAGRITAVTNASAPIHQITEST
jgi:hypothetical protein